MPTPRKYNTDAERYAAYRQRKKEARISELQVKGLPALPAVPTMPGTRRWLGLMEQARYALTTMHDEMDHYLQERSEKWQESEAGQAFQERIDNPEIILDKIAELES